MFNRGYGRSGVCIVDFKIVNHINTGKSRDELDKVRRKDYSPYLINKALSYFPDTILQANQMNMASFIDIQAQYDYLFYAVRKRKRYSKWYKGHTSEMISILRDVLECSPRAAEVYLLMLSKDEIKKLKKVYGGS